MKEGLTPTALMERLKADEARIKDYVVDTRELAVLTEDGRTDVVVPAGTFEPTHHFLRQLGGDLKIPADLFDRLRMTHPEHFDHLVNGLLARWGKDHGGKVGRRLLRTYVDGGEDGRGIARALMSDQYRPIDNFPIAKAVLPIIAKIPGVRIPSCNVTETKLYMKVIAPGTEVDLRDFIVPGTHHIYREGDGPDPVQAGFVLSNSEVGNGAVSIDQLVYRLVCSNGLITEKLLRRNHIGSRLVADEHGVMFRPETIAADDKALMMKVEDHVASAVDGIRFQQIAAQFGEKMTGATIEKPIEAMKTLAPSWGLNDSEADAIVEHLIAGGDLSQFGAINAITRAAQDVDSFDRSVELEELGGEVFRMSSKQWEALVA